MPAVMRTTPSRSPNHQPSQYHHPPSPPRFVPFRVVSPVKTLADLQVNYVDLYLMHWPFAFAQRDLDFPLRLVNGCPNPKLTITEEYRDTWRAMEALVDSGRVKAIGVCNFTQAQLHALMAESKTVPAVNQIEAHPYLSQAELRNFCARHGIHCMAYSPLGSGDSYSGSSAPPKAGCTLLANPQVNAIASRLGKTAGQVLIRWSIQSGFVCIPKSAQPARIASNLQVLDWELGVADMELLNGLNEDFRYSIGYLPGHYNCSNAPWGSDGKTAYLRE